ncbi:integrase [Sinorhizobium meliloti]|uniref:tyrosine-type recombinase/integrase n=1 Tax=Rhizobium meliloti TaxID=382 RepID=UPI000FD7BCF0|nr:tyrosine-type recombinase/integrase [Sinorhizobium meliloti]RVJ02421.1 integrase [Sinorhizobium meliloti]
MTKQKGKGKTSDAFKARYPGVSLFQRKGKSDRWRFQKKGMKPQLLPAGLEPFTAEFDEAYRGITMAMPAPGKADIVAMPNGSAPGSFRHIWKLVMQTEEWTDLDAQSQLKNERMATEFFKTPIDPREPPLWGDAPVSVMTFEDLERLKLLWGKETPSKPWHMKVMLRKIFYLARRKNLRVDDPTELVKWKRGAGKNGSYVGWKAWPEQIQLQFEEKHPIGSAARTCYALALWMGNRRGDIAHLRWDQLVTVEIDGELVTGFEFEQQKRVQSDEDMIQFRPLTAMLAEALAPLTRDEGTVLKTAYGNAFSEKSLTGMMAHWCKQAGIPVSNRKTGVNGYTLHGLRKSYARMLAENGASFQMQKDMLGHTTMQQVQLYARGADKKKITAAAGKLLDERLGSKRTRPRLRVVGE